MTTELPTHVAFKGDNGLYISACPTNGKTYLIIASESSDDPTVKNTIRVIYRAPLTVQIKSDSAKYWKRDGTTNYILADTDDPAITDKDTLFEVTPTERANVMALRNVGNNMYCARNTTNKYLSACTPSITPQAKLEVVIVKV